jgi:hypothetical protein
MPMIEPPIVDMTGFYLILGIYVLILIAIVFISLFIYFWSDSKKSRFLKFNTEHECELLSGNIDNMKFRTKNKTWHIFKSKPIIINTLFGKRPLYLIRDESCLPFEFDKNKLVMSAESLKNFCDHDNMKTILKLTSEPFKEKLIFLIIGCIMGFFMGIVIKMMMG